MNLIYREIHSIMIISANEFYRIIRHPMVLIIIGLLISIAAFNGGSGHLKMPLYEEYNTASMITDDVFFLCFGDIFSTSLLLLIILALFLGLMTIADERSSRSLGILLTKPLYKRDVITGKFLGLSAFILLLAIFVVIINVSFIMIAFRGPLSYYDLIFRSGIFIMLIFLCCSIAMSLAILIGIVFENLFGAIIGTVFYLYFDWLMSPRFFKNMMDFMPSRLYNTIISAKYTNINLFFTSVPFTEWLSYAFPYLIFMILELFILILIDCHMFSRRDAL